MKIYVSDIVELYKDMVIFPLVNSSTIYLSLHIVQCWHTCVLNNEQTRYLPVILYYYVVAYLYYFSCIFPNQIQ